MRVGSLVECIDDSPGRYPSIYSLVKGEIYTIEAFICNGRGVRLEELPTEPGNDPRVTGWYIERFREVQPPMKININEIIFQPEIA